MLTLAVIVLTNSGLVLVMLSFTSPLSGPWEVAILRLVGILLPSIVAGLFYRAVTRPRA